MYSEHLHQNKAAVAALPPRDEASAAGIARIDKLLAHFHRGGKCHWRTKSLRNILWQSEIAMLLATNIHKMKSTLDDIGKSEFTEMLIEVYTFCNDGLSVVGEGSYLLNDELVYAFIDSSYRDKIIKNDGNEWFFSDSKSLFINVLKETFTYIGSSDVNIGGMYLPNQHWLVNAPITLDNRLVKYGDLMSMSHPFGSRVLMNIIIYAINILGGMLSNTLFATERHRLTNIMSALSIAETLIKSSKANHKAVAMITDGKEVAIQYRLVDPKTNKASWIWCGDNVNSDQYRAFSIKGCKKHIEFVAHTGDEGRAIRKGILFEYKRHKRNIAELSEA